MTPELSTAPVAVRGPRPWLEPELLGLVLALTAMALAPLVLSAYAQRVVTTAFLFVALAQAWNLIGGYAGLMSLAGPAFFGVSAILTAFLAVRGIHPVLAGAAGVLLAVLVAFLVGKPTLRLMGHYFVVATLLVTEGLRNLILNINAYGFSGGVSINLFNATGLQNLTPTQFNLFFYFLMLAIAGVSMLVVYTFERSRSGYALRAIRDSQRAAASVGINVAREKMKAFLISAAMMAVVGAIWAFWLGTVETNDAFSMRVAFDVIVIVFLGGRGTLWGPIAGAVLLVAINETIGVEFPEIHQILSGLLVALVVLFQPDGLAGALRGGIRSFTLSRMLSNLRRYKVK